LQGGHGKASHTLALSGEHLCWKELWRLCWLSPCLKEGLSLWRERPSPGLGTFPRQGELFYILTLVLHQAVSTHPFCPEGQNPQAEKRALCKNRAQGVVAEYLGWPVGSCPRLEGQLNHLEWVWGCKVGRREVSRPC
jgi:hypothetical protein